MISYKLVSDESRMSAARMIHDEKIMELGCNMEAINEIIHTDRVWPFYHQFKNIGKYYEKCMGGIISHEIIHSIIRSLEGSEDSHSFDNVDNNHEISIMVVIEP